MTNQIIIAPEDANVFIAFKRHREKFLVLLEGGAFELDNGKVVVNVHNGQFQSIYVDRMTYRREK